MAKLATPKYSALTRLAWAQWSAFGVWHSTWHIPKSESAAGRTELTRDTVVECSAEIGAGPQRAYMTYGQWTRPNADDEDTAPPQR